MKRIYILTLVSLLAVCSSCKRYLDIKPNGKTIPKTADEFAALLHSRLNDIDYGDDETIIGNIKTVSDIEFYSDNLDANLTLYPEGSPLQQYIGTDLNKMQTRYGKLYSWIRDCNIVIGNLKSQGTDNDNTILGTAYAIRGASYYLLLREFCMPFEGNEQPGLPLVTEFNMEGKPVRSTYQQTVNQIEDDLNKSISFHVTNKIFRFTEDVSRAYLSRLHFWTKNWDKAIAPATELLGKYPMLDFIPYADMIQSRNVQKGNTLLRSYIFNNTSSDISYRTGMGLLLARPASKEFYDLFTEKENDVRYQLFFGEKRKNNKNFFAGIRTDEMCLILAEAYAHKSDEGKALEYLNLIRSKRIAGNKPYTMASLPKVVKGGLIAKDATGAELTPLMQAILNERRKELYGEGDRFFELKRNGSPTFWIAAKGRKYTTEPYMYTFPIPRTDVALIPGLIQNPGYIN